MRNWTAEKRALVPLIARTCRDNPNDPRIPELKRSLRMIAMREHIAKLVNGDPPLTDDMRTELCTLITRVQSNCGETGTDQTGATDPSDSPSSMDSMTSVSTGA